MHLGIGLEFARAMNLPFDQAAEHAAKAGYRFIEPYVYAPAVLELNSHLKWESASGYHHINASDANVADLRQTMTRLGLEFSAFDAHSSLLLPHVGVPYVIAAIDLAADVGCPIVMSDEGPVPQNWMDLNRAFDLMCLSIEQIVIHAQSRGVKFAIELHNALTTKSKYLEMLLQRFGPEELGVNFDTGNSFLAGNDPAEMLASVVHRVIHVHLKDIPASALHLRGQVTGTRVGVAAGDGVVDLPLIIDVLAGAGYAGAVSVECDTYEQACRSQTYLSGLLRTSFPEERPAEPVLKDRLAASPTAPNLPGS